MSVDEEGDTVRGQILAVPTRPVRILEAGCGRRWEVPIGPSELHITGVDLDSAALEARLTVERDLDDAVVGDLHSIELPVSSFDVIYCSYVLEHASDPSAILGSFSAWLKPGGIAIVRVPDSESAHGFLSRMTPHWFHIAVYRYVLGRQDAGRPGHAPYRIHYTNALTRRGMEQLCQEHGLQVQDVIGHSHPAQSGRHRAALMLESLIGACSLGRLSRDHQNLTFFIERPPVASGVLSDARNSAEPLP